MNNRDRWNAIYSFEKPDRIPIYFFGTWPETKVEWERDGYDCKCSVRSHSGPQIKGMDPDWEGGMWGNHGLFRNYTVSDLYKVLEENEEYRIIRQSDGSIEKELVKSTSINHTIQHAMEPTRESWERLKTMLDPKDSRRYPENLEEKIPELKNKDMVRIFHGGSLYGWIRNWMGFEQISYFMFDEPELLDEIVGYIVDFQIEVSGNALSKIEMDAAYIWEDCCGATQLEARTTGGHWIVPLTSTHLESPTLKAACCLPLPTLTWMFGSAKAETEARRAAISRAWRVWGVMAWVRP